MKRITAILLAAVFLLLAGCASRPAVYTVEHNGESFTVDTENGTITHGEDVYTYALDTDSIDIIYPNGAAYWWRTSGSVGYGGWDDNYDEERYVSGSTLVNILEEEIPEEPASPWKIILAVVLALLGLWQIIWPRAAWYLQHGWQYKNAEPSEAGIFSARVSGVVFIVLAVVLFFV